MCAINHWKIDALAASCDCFYNIFEDVVQAENTDVGSIKKTMRESGALAALMSGSGPAVFGVFEVPEKAEQACSLLQQKGYVVFVCHPVKQSAE